MNYDLSSPMRAVVQMGTDKRNRKDRLKNRELSIRENDNLSKTNLARDVFDQNNINSDRNFELEQSKFGLDKSKFGLSELNSDRKFGLSLADLRSDAGKTLFNQNMETNKFGLDKSRFGETQNQNRANNKYRNKALGQSQEQFNQTQALNVFKTGQGKSFLKDVYSKDSDGFLSKSGQELVGGGQQNLVYNHQTGQYEAGGTNNTDSPPSDINPAALAKITADYGSGQDRPAPRYVNLNETTNYGNNQQPVNQGVQNGGFDFTSITAQDMANLNPRQREYLNKIAAIQGYTPQSVETPSESAINVNKIGTNVDQGSSYPNPLVKRFNEIKSNLAQLNKFKKQGRDLGRQHEQDFIKGYNKNIAKINKGNGQAKSLTSKFQFGDNDIHQKMVELASRFYPEHDLSNVSDIDLQKILIANDINEVDGYPFGD